MSDSNLQYDLNLQENWMKWYPQEIFLKNSQNKKNILFHLDKMNKKDFCVNIKNQDFSYDDKQVKIKIDDILQKKYEEGFKKGFLKGQEEQDKLKEKLNNLFFSFENDLSKFENKLYSELLKIILKISSYVIGKNLNVDKSILINYIKKMINENSFLLKTPKLIVHPDNKVLIENTFNKFLHDHKWRLEYDDSIDLNGCKIISEDSCLDATVNARWQELYRLIFSEEY
ncbi:flagellar assembly protein FliH [Buchnera aphidicola (Macrosiphoniella sanborni)]|uniref:Flagellar assembly protein FliH n=1 Tax=Buchnera aphidicola (Macrosiphoniella sanborni) TaxID=1241865 RepID=A0A4D6Y214_9GAMM|nr:FliH/SctL family protein [Buchnera aphidicola]QCI23642.1 flagellar assembly protein FliH [Buchnera aphidicola (Macrosiphoniella sanborni)]